MHELSVCRNIIKQVNQVADQYKDCVVYQVHIRLGPLSGVFADLLQAAYPLASAKTPAADGELLIELVPVRVRCMVCGKDSDASPNRLVCGICDNWRTQLLSGDELILQRVELRAANH